MWEQRAAARRLPLELVAEHFGLDRDQDEVALAAEMLGCGLSGLLGGGEMNEPIAVVDRGATIDTGAFGVAPLRRGANLVDEAHHRLSARIRLAETRSFRFILRAEPAVRL